jgi:hypothetical protein
MPFNLAVFAATFITLATVKNHKIALPMIGSYLAVGMYLCNKDFDRSVRRACGEDDDN